MKLGLRARLMLGMCTLLGLTTAACLTGLVMTKSMAKSVNTLVDRTLAEARHADAAERAMLQARRSEKDFLLRKDASYLPKVQAAANQLETSLNKVIETSTSPERQDTARRGLQLANGYVSSIEALVSQYTKRGLTHNDGLEGKLRAAVHELETDLKSNTRDDLTVLMLMARRHEKDYLLRGDTKYLQSVEQRRQEFAEATTEIDPETRDRWASLWNTYVTSLQALVEAETKIAELSEAARSASHNIETVVDEIHTGATAEVEPAREKLAAMQARTTTLLVIALVASIAMASLVAFVTIHGVVSAIRPIVARADAIASGDLTGQALPIAVQDDLGRLAGAINRMSESLKGLVGEIKLAATDVSGMSQQVAAGSTETAEQTREQEAQVSQVAAAVAQMTASIEEIAGKTVSVANAATDAGNSARDGANVVSETIGTIQDVAQRVDTLNTTMQRLGSRSEQIGAIVVVIDEIAEQTNLLALNAAIEAARAGEHGRGFAVVADEVRKLADRTTEATSQVSDSIREIQEDTRTAVEAMSDSRTRIGAGVELVEQAGGALGQITDRTNDVSGMLQMIAAATQQQASAAEEISRNVDSIRSSNEHAALGAAQAAEASNQLSDRAVRLNRTVGTFRTVEA
ncbi:MAG: methyl-accepting chemotaxis protein [Phycisphaerales bacterium JB064]